MLRTRQFHKSVGMIEMSAHPVKPLVSIRGSCKFFPRQKTIDGENLGYFRFRYSRTGDGSRYGDAVCQSAGSCMGSFSDRAELQIARNVTSG